MKSSEKEIRYVRLSSLTRTFEVSNRRSPRGLEPWQRNVNTRQWGLYNEGPVWYSPKWHKIDLSSFFSAILSTDRVVHRSTRLYHYGKTWRSVGETRGNACSGGTHAACGRMARLGHFRLTGANRAGQCARKRSENTAAKCRRTDWQSSYCQTRSSLWPVLGGTVFPPLPQEANRRWLRNAIAGQVETLDRSFLFPPCAGFGRGRSSFRLSLNEPSIEALSKPGLERGILSFGQRPPGRAPYGPNRLSYSKSRANPASYSTLSITIYSEMPCGVGRFWPLTVKVLGGPRLPKRVRNARTKNPPARMAVGSRSRPACNYLPA